MNMYEYIKYNISYIYKYIYIYIIPIIRKNKGNNRPAIPALSCPRGTKSRAWAMTTASKPISYSYRHIVTHSTYISIYISIYIYICIYISIYI